MLHTRNPWLTHSACPVDAGGKNGGISLLWPHIFNNSPSGESHSTRDRQAGQPILNPSPDYKQGDQKDAQSANDIKVEKQPSVEHPKIVPH